MSANPTAAIKMPATRFQLAIMKLRSHKMKKTLFVMTVLVPILAFYIVFYGYPMVYSLIASLTDMRLGIGTSSFVGLSQYIGLMRDARFVKALGNTLRFIVLFVPGAILISLLVALGFQRMKGWARTVLTVMYFIPVVTATVPVAIIWKWLYHPTAGLINMFLETFGLPYIAWLGDTRWALVAVAIMSIWKNIGFSSVLLLAGLEGIPTDFLDAASIDGAGAWRRLRYIMLPLLTPTLLLVTVMNVIGSMVVFTQVYVMTATFHQGAGGPADSTRVLALHIYEAGILHLEIGNASAMAWVLFAFVMLFTYVQMRLMRTEWEY